MVLTDGEHYLIHGADNDTPSGMFKKMEGIWDFNPAAETAHFVEFNLDLPELEKLDPLS